MESNQLWWIILGLLAVGAGVCAVLLVRSRARAPGKSETEPPSIPTPSAAPGPESTTPLPPADAAPLSEEARVSRGLTRTRVFFQQTFDKLFTSSKSEEFFGDMEEILLTADIGVDFTERVIADLRTSFGMRLPVRAELRNKLAEILLRRLPPARDGVAAARPHVIMVVGVNGAGKTTTVAKLCRRFQADGKKTLVGGADTFRAAAVEQLRTWVERVGAEGVFHAEGADPSAVAFDSVRAAVSRGSDICLIDTAGRLHTKANLMAELKKMHRVVGKALPGAPHDVWLVVDGSTGQNALNQAREFHEHLGLTGVIVTKLDGSAKGGGVLAIGSELKLPVVFIGVGESAEDLVPFNGPTFVDEILAGL